MLRYNSKISDNYNNWVILLYGVPHYTITEQVATMIRFTHILYNNDTVRAILWKFLMHCIHFATIVADVTQKIFK